MANERVRVGVFLLVRMTHTAHGIRAAAHLFHHARNCELKQAAATSTPAIRRGTSNLQTTIRFQSWILFKKRSRGRDDLTVTRRHALSGPFRMPHPFDPSSPSARTASVLRKKDPPLGRSWDAPVSQPGCWACTPPHPYPSHTRYGWGPCFVFGNGVGVGI